MSPTPASKQWERILNETFGDINQTTLQTFKSSAINHKLAIWDPERNGVRFLKELIYNLCRDVTQEQWSLIQRIKNREVGAPYSIRYSGTSICMDYLQAAFELTFLKRHINLDNISILEVGAGYGRTCHALLSNFDILRYDIIDLPEMRELVMPYLKTVLQPDDYAKVHFIDANEPAPSGKESYELCINVDSMAEMKEETVRDYLAMIDHTCRAFYTKNPVGKYRLSENERDNASSESVKLALETGILRDIIDIYDTEAVEKQSRVFVKEYTPSTEWTCQAEAWAKPWSFYWQALYTKG